MGINGDKIRFSFHIINNFVFFIKIGLFIGKVNPIILKMNDSKIKPRCKDLNLFGVIKQPTECVIDWLIESGYDLVGALREFLHELVKVLKSYCSSSSLPVYFFRSVEKYQVRVHSFSESLVVVIIPIVFASANLLVFAFYFQFFLRKLIADKNYWNIWLFGFPLE